MQAQTQTAGRAVGTYRDRIRQFGARGRREPGYDELVGADGVHPEDELLARTIEQLGPRGLRDRARQAQRFVDSDGVTFGTTEDGHRRRPWRIDPLPVILSATEWETLERGLQQRARLLDAVLRDVYGTRTMIRRGLIPPEIIFGNPGFVRQADGVRLPTEQQLILTAADVARGPDGAWQIFGDRAETPSGAGYAMATRRIVARTMPAVHRRSRTARLRGFFHTMSSTLRSCANAQEGSARAPRVVVLSPGDDSDTAFDQAFLATLLGFPLVQGDDLAMRDGAVWLRGSGQPQQVDVVLRRVEGQLADPLELNSGSRLGVPGLIEAARRRRVSVVNPIGAGVLENPALVHFLPTLSRALLDEDLAVDQPQSWWCGDPAERRHVLTNLDSLVVKTSTPTVGESPTVLGWTLSSAQASQLRARIEQLPWAFTAQAPLTNSTAPVVTGAGIEPRRLVLRTFGVADGDGYAFLPGALGRVAADADADVVSTRAGGLAKDVWVSVDDEHFGSGWGNDRDLARISTVGSALAPRIADDLYWVGRYTERSEFTARLLKVADDLTEDFSSRPGSLGAVAMSSVQHAVTMVTGTVPQQRLDAGLDYTAPDRWHTDPDGHLRDLVAGDEPGSLGYGVNRLERSAGRVRDQLSVDTWPVLNRLQETVARAAHVPVPGADAGDAAAAAADAELGEGADGEGLQDLLEDILESTLALEGIASQSMIRDASWAYLDAGGRLERAVLTTELLRSTLAIERSPVIEGQIVEAVLQVGESVITHRRRIASGQGPALPVQSALHLLAVDATNPRSVAFQLDRLADDLDLIGDEVLRERCAQVVPLVTGLDLDSASSPDRRGLGAELTRVRAALGELADAMAERHFRRQAGLGTQPTEWAIGGGRRG